MFGRGNVEDSKISDMPEPDASQNERCDGVFSGYDSGYSYGILNAVLADDAESSEDLE